MRRHREITKALMRQGRWLDCAAAESFSETRSCFDERGTPADGVDLLNRTMQDLLLANRDSVLEPRVTIPNHLDIRFRAEPGENAWEMRFLKLPLDQAPDRPIVTLVFHALKIHRQICERMFVVVPRAPLDQAGWLVGKAEKLLRRTTELLRFYRAEQTPKRRIDTDALGVLFEACLPRHLAVDASLVFRDWSWRIRMLHLIFGERRAEHRVPPEADLGTLRGSRPARDNGKEDAAAPTTTSSGRRGSHRTPRQTTHEELDDEGDSGNGPGCGNGRDDASGAARAASSDKRRRRSGSCVGIRPD